MDMSRINPEVIRINRPEAAPPLPPAAAGRPSFSGALDRAMSVRFSDHAAGRMARYGINLSEADAARLNAAVGKVAQKGSRESLVMLDDKMFVVAVKNNTVITAINRQNLKESVFTNIDSAVIA